jgi:hypothetical protein
MIVAEPVQAGPTKSQGSDPQSALLHGSHGAPGRSFDGIAPPIMAPGFGHDFSRVRVHPDPPSELRSNHARAGAEAGADTGLPPIVHSRLERQFNYPLAALKIHADEEGSRVAARHSALAVSRGAHIYFARGAYAPGSERGDRILRHEVAHYVQRQPGNRSNHGNGRTDLLEAEADWAAGRASGPIPVLGQAEPSQALAMKTYVSTVGGNPYLDQAIKFYQLWENETATRIGSYQDVVDDLAGSNKPLAEFRMVAHANGQNLFLPLLTGAKGYADLPTIGIQTRRAAAMKFSQLGHITSDMVATVHGWLAADKAGKALLAKVGQTGGFSGFRKEWVWWAVDQHFASNAQEDPPQAGQTATDPAERATLVSEVQTGQSAIRPQVVADLPQGASAADVDDLKTQTLAALAKQKWVWGKEPAGALRERLERLRNADVAAFRKEAETGALEQNLKTVKKRVSDKTTIEIRGCNIGSNDAYLNGIREFFGTKPDKLPSISAPKLYQFFGNPGVLVLPQGKGQPKVADSLKFLFEETFDDKSLAKDVEKAIKKAGLQTVGELAEVLRHADIKAEFERWWQMKQTAKGGSGTAVANATLKDFQDFISTSPRTFPINAPGVSASNSLWYLLLLPNTAIDALLAWVKDQGYTLPGGADPLKTFFGGSSKWDPKKFTAGLDMIVVDWLGDKYPVPEKIYFPEDPDYKANIRKLP